jgi:hypothetical protein
MPSRVFGCGIWIPPFDRVEYDRVITGLIMAIYSGNE